MSVLSSMSSVSCRWQNSKESYFAERGRDKEANTQTRTDGEEKQSHFPFFFWTISEAPDTFSSWWPWVPLGYPEFFFYAPNNIFSFHYFYFIFFKAFNFVFGHSRLTNNVVIVSGAQRRDSIVHICVSNSSPNSPPIQPATLTLSRVPCAIR